MGHLVLKLPCFVPEGSRRACQNTSPGQMVMNSRGGRVETRDLKVAFCAPHKSMPCVRIGDKRDLQPSLRVLFAYQFVGLRRRIFLLEANPICATQMAPLGALRKAIDAPAIYQAQLFCAIFLLFCPRTIRQATDYTLSLPPFFNTLTLNNQRCPPQTRLGTERREPSKWPPPSLAPNHPFYRLFQNPLPCSLQRATARFSSTTHSQCALSKCTYWAKKGMIEDRTLNYLPILIPTCLRFLI